MGISLNCVGMSDNDALREIQKVEKETKLPATDPIKFGVDKFIDVVRPSLTMNLFPAFRFETQAHTKIAREIRDVQNNIIVLLKDEDGIMGLGRLHLPAFLAKM